MGRGSCIGKRMENDGWEAIADTKVIGFGSRCIYQTMASQVLADKGLATFTAMEFDSTEMIKQTMMFGMGLSLMPLTSVQEELQSGKLLKLQQEKTILLEHGLIHRSGKDLSAPVQACKEHIISYFLAQKERENWLIRAVCDRMFYRLETDILSGERFHG
jgi:DNA-binding transcriptional LysR family regulator